MKVYVAAGYATRDAVRMEVVPLLEEAGHDVVSSWLKEGHEVTTGTVGTAPVKDEYYARLHSENDINEVQKADVLLLLTDQWCLDNLTGWDGSLLRNSGGRHVETGVALGADKGVIFLGDPENIFHRGLCLQAIEIGDALELLRALET